MNDISPSQDSGYVKRVVIAAYGYLLLCGWIAIPWLPLLVHEALRARVCLTLTSRRICNAVASLVLFLSLLPLVLTQGRACITNSTGAFIQNGHFGPIFLSDMDEPGRWGELGGVDWPLWMWTTLSVLALMSIGAIAWWIAWTAVQWCSRTTYVADSRLVASLSLVLMIGLSAVAILLFVEPHMDRYLLFLFPPLIISWLLIAAKCEWKLSRFAIAWAATWMVLHMGIAIVFTHDMLAWNDARWRFVNAQLNAGLPAEKIDAGRDVNAWLRLDEDSDSLPRDGDTSKWWSGRSTVALAVGRRPGWHEVDRLPWNAWATGRIHHLLVLELDELNESSIYQRLDIEGTP